MFVSSHLIMCKIVIRLFFNAVTILKYIIYILYRFLHVIWTFWNSFIYYLHYLIHNMRHSFTKACYILAAFSWIHSFSL